MKVVAYLSFTLISIFIQFCVMDLTQEKINLEDKTVNFNVTSNKEKFEELLKTFTQKPHALFYRTQEKDKSKELNFTSAKYSGNASAQGTDVTTTISSTIIDELYDESTSTTEDSFTTEPFSTSSDFDNVTEISFFDKKNQSNTKPGKSKVKAKKDCVCNFLVCTYFVDYLINQIVHFYCAINMDYV